MDSVKFSPLPALAAECDPFPDTPIFVDSGQLLGELDSRAVTLGDVDGDGDLDAVVANYSGLVPIFSDEVWLNQGASQRGTLGVYRLGQALQNSSSSDITLRDIDGDAIRELYLGVVSG